MAKDSDLVSDCVAAIDYIDIVFVGIIWILLVIADRPGPGLKTSGTLAL